MKTGKKNQKLREDLSWIKRSQKVQVRYDLLFALCMACSFMGLLTLFTK